MMNPKIISGFCFGLLVAVTLCGSVATQSAAQEQKAAVKLFYVYSDKGAANSNFFIPSGWMGDYADLTLDNGWSDDVYAGDTCIKISYSNRASSGARWAGIYWQNPANNWGSKENAGVDLRGVSRLTFWARGERGGERIEEFKMGGISGPYPDSDTAGIGPVVLTPEWKQYSIDLRGKDLSHIIGGFAWSANLDGNPKGCTFYLDEIRYE
ncbi:hypothetical protein BU251_03645 [Candidatus Velamenicoccus archaeovorus]|uniref:Uncharacterized protein n=1 Tax=Velamenicoccus archaeovorus TaxID=1930593 RepID=A0A410P494_VELA1|nr:hypothetical protein [Candidatus Velamenicoccus archaeovorus]QAT16888.1 hypothetical protein BU251_03645 [Candidatus Velamenicoccus archaeovorus]